MKLKSLFILITALIILPACQGDAPVNPDVLPTDFDYAAGDFPHAVTLNNVSIDVKEARVVPPDPELVPGYVYVVLTISITNRSERSVRADEFNLLDEYINLYESWQTNVSFGHELTAMPDQIGPGQAAEGNQVFIVPSPALQANMRVRWQSAALESRIDLFLGELSLPQ